MKKYDIKYLVKLYELEVENFNSYLDEMVVSISEKKEAAIKQYTDTIDRIEDPNQQDIILDWYIDDILKYDDSYTKILLNSNFTSAFSLFEIALKKICQFQLKKYSIPFEFSDLKGDSIIGKCKTILSKISKIDFKLVNEDWKKITDYNKVRNLIIHNDSNFRKDKNKKIEEQEMHGFITSSKHIKVLGVNRTDFYINDKQFTSEFLDVTLKFIKFLESTFKHV